VTAKSTRGRFAWYELMTTDVAAAAAFYGEVVGWETRDASAPGMPYTLLGMGEHSVGALMNLPPEARKAGVTPRWIGYVTVDDVEAAADHILGLGGFVHVPPTDIPEISRVAVVADPQMAMFGLITWRDGRDERAAKAREPGRGGWHELLAADAKPAFDFYAELFGWQKAEASFDSSGAYQIFSTGGQMIGGMFTKPAVVPVPFWLFYFNVSDVDAAAERTKAAGGQVLEGPLDATGGAWMVRCLDPQDAMFALIGRRGKGSPGYFERNASAAQTAKRDRR
jgi:hypothetical protein